METGVLAGYEMNSVSVALYDGKRDLLDNYGKAYLALARGGYPPAREETVYHANFFPLSVWMQPSTRAKRYKECGVNIYMNQW